MKESKPLQIGITGGIGSGKSTICKIFNQLGIPTYDADSRAKWLLNHDPFLKEIISKEFGHESYDSKGEYNKSYIAAIVFNNSEKINLLNSIVHPRVGEDYSLWVDKNNSNAGYLIKEAALLFESESYKKLDKIITVEASEEIRISRILKRDPFRSISEIKSILSKQMNDESRRQLSDYVIVNDDKHLVIHQVLELHQIFQSLSSKSKVS